MKSTTTERFRKLFDELPNEVQEQAREAYRKFQSDPNYTSLQFKRVRRNPPIYSARVNLDYRVVGIMRDDEIRWFWIGTHSDYNNLLNQF